MADSNPPRIVVLASGSGTNLQVLLDAIRDGDLVVQVVAVVSDRREVGALRRSEAAGIPSLHVPLVERRDAVARVGYDRELADSVAAFAPDLIVLAGWMHILSPAFLDRFPRCVVNVHPALLPGDGGATVSTSAGPIPALRGHRAVRDALRLAVPVTGATVHWVTPDVDAGPVILQEEVPILPGDDEAHLHARIKAVEHRILPRSVGLAVAQLGTSTSGTSPCALYESSRRTRENATEGGEGDVAGGDRTGLEVGSGAR